MKIKEKEIYKFDYISSRISWETDQSSFYISSLLNFVKIDNIGLHETDLVDKLHVDLKQIVAMAIDLSIKNIIKAVLDRSVKNTLETTRDLVVKDFFNEADEHKFFEAAKSMITNLTWNLALVTCWEPLRVEIIENLESLLTIQTDLEEPIWKHLKELLTNTNLDLAC